MRAAWWIVMLERYGIWAVAVIAVAGLAVFNLIGHWIDRYDRKREPRAGLPPGAR